MTRAFFALLLFLEKAYSYIFFVLMSFFIDEWRALLVMVVGQCIALGALICGVAIVAGHTPLLIPKPTLALGCLIVYGMTTILIHVEAAERRERLRRDSLHAFARGDVAGDERRRRGNVIAARTRSDHDLGPGIEKALRDRRADAARPSGD